MSPPKSNSLSNQNEWRTLGFCAKFWYLCHTHVIPWHPMCISKAPHSPHRLSFVARPNSSFHPDGVREWSNPEQALTVTPQHMSSVFFWNDGIFTKGNSPHASRRHLCERVAFAKACEASWRSPNKLHRRSHFAKPTVEYTYNMEWSFESSPNTSSQASLVAWACRLVCCFFFFQTSEMLIAREASAKPVRSQNHSFPIISPSIDALPKP